MRIGGGRKLEGAISHVSADQDSAAAAVAVFVRRARYCTMAAKQHFNQQPNMAEVIVLRDVIIRWVVFGL